MSKIAIITRSEYLRRVRSKGFIIATLLAPLFIVAIGGIGALVGYMSQDRADRAVAISDHTGVVGQPLVKALPERYRAFVSDAPEDSLRARVRRGELDGYLVLPTGLMDGSEDATYVSERGAGGFTGDILLREVVSSVVREQRLRAMGAQEDVIAVLDQQVRLRTAVLTETGEAADASWLYSVLGYIMGFVIYMAIFIAGAMVLRGVIEEKSSRITEIMASSARPFELLMGKVLGIGGAGLTQIILWGVLVLVGFAFLGPVIMTTMTPEMPPDAPEMAAFDLSAMGISPLALFAYFVLFFFGGYLLYASLFAAVGSAVESEADAQSLQVPITIPAIVPILLLPLVADNPDSTVALILSLIPFFSPVLMPVRIAAGAAPFWEIAAALALLALAFIAAIWLASRIYRVGILMYGKKATFRDLARWARYA
jgi:ABC-2 type transport system permease protein